MTILPTQYIARRAWLTSFWLVICASSGLLFVVLSVLLASPWWLGAGVILTVALALLGLLWSQAISLPYRAWNKLAMYFAWAGRLYLTGIYFFVMFVVVGQVRSSFKLGGAAALGASGWVPRKPLAPAAYPSQYDVAISDSSHKGWVRTYLSWALHSGNFWAVFLLPFLILLNALEPDGKKTIPIGIYTLF